MDIERDIINRFIAESILKALTDNPADKDIADQQNPTENMAPIVVYDDEVEEAYDMSKEVREYE
jgi:hypothetical protein